MPKNPRFPRKTRENTKFTKEIPWVKLNQGNPNNQYGAKFYTPPPPHLWKYPSRVGGVYKRGVAYKIPAAWGLKLYTPHPPPLKNAF